MTNALRDSISTLAATFAAGVVAAIRSSNLEDILDLASEAKAAAPTHAPAAASKAEAAPAPRPKRTRARSPRNAAAPAVKPPATPAAPAAKSVASAKTARMDDGRLLRRSPADIANALERVLTHLKANKAGLRSEQIRDQLGMHKKEMPRVLKAGLDKKALKSKGQKRSTVYTAM